jgi:hypothetical protein
MPRWERSLVSWETVCLVGIPPSVTFFFFNSSYLIIHLMEAMTVGDGLNK